MIMSIGFAISLRGAISDRIWFTSSFDNAFAYGPCTSGGSSEAQPVQQHSVSRATKRRIGLTMIRRKFVYFTNNFRLIRIGSGLPALVGMGVTRGAGTS